MRYSRLRIFWITALSIMTMLVSSVVSSAPLMTFHMLSNNQTQMMSSHCGEPSSDTMQHHDTSHTMKHQSSFMACAGDVDMQHNCCGATCVSVLGFVPVTTNSALLPAQLALIPHEPLLVAVSRGRSLYRPPIA
ncbi:hypothetical protein AB2S62_08195 [Vibrio sp. NTOU-M3]|uniref:hypothetical protein n=1 Tax=Vibrio sp. NTOU-M3 TaxID=3234954 RepID=UPI00349FC797